MSLFIVFPLRLVQWVTSSGLARRPSRASTEQLKASTSFWATSSDNVGRQVPNKVRFVRIMMLYEKSDMYKISHVKLR